MTSEVIDKRPAPVERDTMTTPTTAAPNQPPAPPVAPAYAVAHLTEPPTHLPEEVLLYMELVQATLDPYGGRFLVHGGSVEVREGTWPGTLVIIAFPDLTAARTWYESDDYSKLKPLRTRHVRGNAVLVDGLPAGYDPARTAAQLRGQGHGSPATV